MKRTLILAILAAIVSGPVFGQAKPAPATATIECNVLIDQFPRGTPSKFPLAGVKEIFISSGTASIGSKQPASESVKLNVRLVSGEVKSFPVASGTRLTFNIPWFVQLQGNWAWVCAQTLVFSPDFKVEAFYNSNKVNEGKWEIVNLASRTFRVVYFRGGFVDSLTMSPDGQVIEGYNQAGMPLRGTRK